jgi:hypothetical protein
MKNNHQPSLWGIGSEKVTQYRPLQPSIRAIISLLCLIIGVLAELRTGFLSLQANSIGQNLLQEACMQGIVGNWSIDQNSVSALVGYAQLQHDVMLGTFFFWASLILIIVGLRMTKNARIQIDNHQYDPKHLVRIARITTTFALLLEAALCYGMFLAWLYFRFLL